MNDNFDNQKEFLLSLRQEINLLRQQVDYLLRNEKPLGLLDLDVLMNRTHTVYDMLCSINLNGNDEEQDFDIDPDAISGLFGSLMQSEQQNEEQEVVPTDEMETKTNENEPVEESVVNGFQEEKQFEEETNAEENPIEEEQEFEDKNFENTSDSVEFIIETPVEKEAAEHFNPMDEPIKDEPVVDELEKSKSEEQPLSDEFGFFFRFDEVADEMSGNPKEQPVQEEKIVHFVDEVPEEEIPERDRVDGEHLVHDNPFVMPVVEDAVNEENFVEEEPVEMQQEEEPVDEPFVEPEEEFVEEIEQIPVVEPIDEEQEETFEPEPLPFVNDFEKDDSEYELNTPETLVEHLQHDDNTLAAKLQQKSINELKAAIGINDKFLFVNELFGGSMEKYNKSIENLDDMKTLNGTLIYLNELKVELQWNSSNEAYQKLLNLIHRKFGD